MKQLNELIQNIRLNHKQPARLIQFNDDSAATPLQAPLGDKT
jgi:hypothetical protein